MADEKPQADDIRHIEAIVESHTFESTTASPKRAADGTILVPQPSDDPRDPLVRRVVVFFYETVGT
jgi:hypothetical protein